ncbi:MAG: hypothetical protein ACPL6C_00815, partial [bacterium]
MLRKFILIFLLIFFSAIYAQISLVGPMGFTVEVDTIDGNFALGLSDGRRLTFDYHYPWAGREVSHLNFMLDDTLYVTSEWILTPCHALDIGYYRESAYFDSTNAIISYDFSGVTLVEKLSIKVLSGLPVMRVCYKVTNERDELVRYGILLNLDITVNMDDNAPFEVDTILFSSGKIFEGDEMPYTLQFFERRITDPLIERFYLRLEDRIPDLLAIGRQSVFFSTCWDIDRESIIDRPYSDIGMVLRWNIMELAPGETDTCIFYAGLGAHWDVSFPILWRTLTSEFYARDCHLEPNPFEFTLEVTNYSSDTLDSLYACLTPDTMFFFSDDSSCKPIF